MSPDGVELTVVMDAEAPQNYPPLPAGQGVTLVGARESCRVRVVSIHDAAAVVTVVSVPRSKTAAPKA